VEQVPPATAIQRGNTAACGQQVAACKTGWQGASDKCKSVEVYSYMQACHLDIKITAASCPWL